MQVLLISFAILLLGVTLLAILGGSLRTPERYMEEKPASMPPMPSWVPPMPSDMTNMTTPPSLPPMMPMPSASAEQQKIETASSLPAMSPANAVASEAFSQEDVPAPAEGSLYGAPF